MKDGNNKNNDNDLFDENGQEESAKEKREWLSDNGEVSWDYYREEKEENAAQLSSAGLPAEEKKGFWYRTMVPFFKSKKGMIIVASILAVLIALGGSGFWIVSHYLNKIDTGEKYTPTNNDGSDIMEDMNFPTINEVPNSELDGTLKDMILKNYMNGKPISSKNVINVLLIGRDTDNEDVDSRSDAMIIASLNKVTKKITMVSLFRDQYIYIPTTNGGTFSKLNHAHSWGGPELLIKTIEGNYKIVIDNYASVNFSSFPKIIDALGGVDLELTQKEANYLKQRFQIDTQSGKVHADGKLALAYSRIRKIDSDVRRNERQRTVLISLFNELKTANAKEMKNVLDSALPYVKTGYSKGDLLSLGTQAITKGWTNYEIAQFTCPQNENYYFSGYDAGNEWFWFVDYPIAAQELQTELYGKSNIVLAADRPNFKLLSRTHGGTSGSGSSSGGSSSGSNSATTTRRTQSNTTHATTKSTTTRPDGGTQPDITGSTKETTSQSTTKGTTKPVTPPDNEENNIQ